jgi:nitroreductase
MDYWDAIRARRNVRAYSDQPIPPADLDRILDAGRRAPSASNRQHWDFVVTTDRNQLEALSKVWRGAGHLAGAAAGIVLVIPHPETERDEQLDVYDLGQATYAIMLAAAGAGVGSGHASIGDRDATRRIFGIPENQVPMYLIGLGYPADRPLRPTDRLKRRPLEEVVHRGRW